MPVLDVEPDRVVLDRWGRVWGAWRRPVMVAVATTAVLRVVTTVVALASAYGVSFPHVVARNPLVLVNVWSHWDTGYYLTIAQHGYPSAAALHQHPGSSL